MDQSTARTMYVEAVQRGDQTLVFRLHDIFVQEQEARGGDVEVETFRQWLQELLSRAEAHELLLLYAAAAPR